MTRCSEESAATARPDVPGLRRSGRTRRGVLVVLTIAGVVVLGCGGCQRHSSDRDVAVLTVPVARDLAARYAGESLLLPFVTEIEPEVARALATHTGGMLAMPSVRTLDAEAARLLAGHEGDLWLRGVERISVDTAEALAEHHGGCLSLDGLREVNRDVAQALSRHPDVTLPVSIRRPR